MVGHPFDKCVIILESHDNSLERISEIHSSYNAWQNSSWLLRDEAEYSISFPQLVSEINETIKKTVFAANFCSFRLIIREREDNQLFPFSV